MYATSISDGGRYPPIGWEWPTYTLWRPNHDRGSQKVTSLLPSAYLFRQALQAVNHHFSLESRFFWWVVKSWKPDIVHALSLDPSGVYTWEGLKGLNGHHGKFVISSWGSDINLGKDNPAIRETLADALRNCDGFIADCLRDMRNAVSLGLDEKKIAIKAPIPVTGGIDEGEIPAEDVGLADRKIILVPKGYENVTNKTTPVLEALHSLGDELVGYEVHVMMSSPETETLLRQMPRWLQEKVHCHEMVPKERLLDLMRRARIMIAPSLSDGTPNTMLEAMAAGALPIMSPVESILEWIEDGENGLIAHALYPDQIAKAVKRGLRDDDLFYRALRRNRELVRTRANRAIIRTQVLEYYRSLVTSETGKVR